MTATVPPASGVRREWRAGWPIRLDLVWGGIPRGRHDPVFRRVGPGLFWITAGTPAGPGTMFVQQHGEVVEATAWGPGADWLLTRLPRMAGEGDDPAGFEPDPASTIGRWWRRWGPHWRVPATGLVWESLTAAILEQKVTGRESRRAFQLLCRGYGEPAPGPAPAGMRVAPSPQAVRQVPSWEWRGMGVDGGRSATLLRATRATTAVAAAAASTTGMALATIAGVGPWTVAEVAFRALGDADAVSVGDYHLANVVGYALTGRPRSTDEQMLELLQPYAGHRHRAVRMIELGGVAAPRYGPRMALPQHHTGWGAAERG